MCLIFHIEAAVELFIGAARLSLLLCFFNLIPIPPLDGSHILRKLTGMSWEAYANFARFGFIGVIIVLQIPQVRDLLWITVESTLGLLGFIFRF